MERTILLLAVIACALFGLYCVSYYLGHIDGPINILLGLIIGGVAGHYIYKIIR